MAILTRETIFNDANDLPSSNWLTALGIVFLFATIVQELVSTNAQNPIEFVGRGANLLGVFLAL